MKAKSLLVFAFIIGFLNATIAQDKKLRVALRAGLYSSRFTFNDLPPTSSKPTGDDAYYAGLQVDVPFGKKISLSPEILYAVSSIQTFSGGFLYDDLSHLFVPVLFKYKFGKVSLLAGPQAELLLSAKGFYREDAPDDDPNFDYYIKRGDIKERSYSKFGIAGVVGAEWVFKYRFGIDARYQFGVTNFKADNADSEMTSLSDDIKANGFQVGIFFRFGKKPRKSS